MACRRLELEAKEFAERVARAEAERDAVCNEATMPKLATEEAVNARAQIESELVLVKRALTLTEDARLKAESERGVAHEVLAVAGEACKKPEEENSHLEDERLALVMELWTMKDDFAAFRDKAIADRESMEAEFDASGDTLFNYGYGCWVFMHNICSSKPQIQDGMLDRSVALTLEFFANPPCPPSISSTAPALDPAVGSKEEHPKISPISAGEEANHSIGPPASSEGGIKDAIAN